MHAVRGVHTLTLHSRRAGAAAADPTATAHDADEVEAGEARVLQRYW